MKQVLILAAFKGSNNGISVIDFVESDNPVEMSDDLAIAMEKEGLVEFVEIEETSDDDNVPLINKEWANEGTLSDVRAFVSDAYGIDDAKREDILKKLVESNLIDIEDGYKE